MRPIRPPADLPFRPSMRWPRPPCVTTCMALTRERERGTYENLLAMPATPLEIMVGKIAPYVVVGLVQSAIVLVCLLYTSDAADERSSVDLGGRRIIKK